MFGWGGIVVVAVGAATWTMDVPRVEAADCAASSTAADLDAFFGGTDAARLAGADYPHAYALPDGRTLWTFQDAFFGNDGRLDNDLFAHNAALIQDGECFAALPSSGGSGTSWIGSWVEIGLAHWFWPLDAEVGADGYLWLFLAEVRNPNGSGATEGAEPVAAWRARYSLPDLHLVDLEPAADPSGALFGYSIVSDDEWTYLYGHCYRQFEAGTSTGFDPTCSPFAYLARVPRGQLDHPPEYWAGTRWTADPASKAPVLTGRQSMPISVERFGAAYVAVSDENDWFGSAVVVRTATAPQGPWTEALRYTPETKCGDRCNNYGAFVLPHLEDGHVVIAQSNNAWNMVANAYVDASLYRTSVRAVAVPGVPGVPAASTFASHVRPLVSRARDASLDGPVAFAAVPETQALDESALVVTTRQPERWSDRLLLALRMVSLAVATLVAAAAATGFATTATRISPVRRRRALARLNAGGTTRAHGHDRQTVRRWRTRRRRRAQPVTSRVMRSSATTISPSK